jgi:hypothetical protein
MNEIMNIVKAIQKAAEPYKCSGLCCWGCTANASRDPDHPECLKYGKQEIWIEAKEKEGA